MSSALEFDVTISDGFGYFYDYDKALIAIESYQKETDMRYCLAWARKKEIDHKNLGADPKPYKIFWSDGDNTKVKSCQMVHDGIPYLVAGSRIYDCQFGVDRNVCQKRKYREAVQKDEQSRRRHKRIQESKKQNCPALIYLREIIKFPHFMIPANTEFYRKKASSNLQKAIRDGSAVGEMRVYVHFPAESAHRNHSFVRVVTPSVDPRIKSKIEELVSERITSVTHINTKLTQFIQTELFEWEKWPEKTDFRYYPKRSYIKNLVNSTIMHLRNSQVDMENINAKIESWLLSQPQDRFFIQTHSGRFKETKDGRSEPLLLLIQTKWQQELLEIYGQKLCLLDAVYKAVGASIPLYFLLVKTNIEYQVAGTMFILHDTSEALSKALGVFREWNPTWNPSTVMCGMSEAEMTAVKSTFSKARILICDYQREQAWSTWLSERRNRMATKKECVLNHLRKLAEASSVQEFSAAEEEFFLSDSWLKLPRLQLWFRKVWQPEYERWVWCYREGGPENQSSHDGIEQVNEMFRHYHSQLSQPRPLLSHLVTMLLDHFLPALYVHQVEDSIEMEHELCAGTESEDPISLEAPHHPLEDLGHKCREIIDHIRSYTYLLKDQAVLRELHNCLSSAYENILHRDLRKIFAEKKEHIEEMEITSTPRQSPTQREDQVKHKVASDKLLEVVGESVDSGNDENVLIKSDRSSGVCGDIVGSYVVHNNILEPIKVEAPENCEYQEETEPKFNTSPKALRTYPCLKKKQAPENTNTSPVDQLKLIPPEVFKLLMSVSDKPLLMSVKEKPRPSQFNTKVLGSKSGTQARTFRILIPVKNKNVQKIQTLVTNADRVVPNADSVVPKSETNVLKPETLILNSDTVLPNSESISPNAGTIVTNMKHPLLKTEIPFQRSMETEELKGNDSPTSVVGLERKRRKVDDKPPDFRVKTSTMHCVRIEKHSSLPENQDSTTFKPVK